MALDTPTGTLQDPQDSLHTSLMAIKYVSGLETLGFYTLFSLTGWDLSFALAGGLAAVHTMALVREVDNVAKDRHSDEWENYAAIETVAFAGLLPMTAAAEIHPVLKAASVMAEVVGIGWFANLHNKCLEYRLKTTTSTAEEI